MNSITKFFKNCLYDHLNIYYEDLLSILEQNYFDSILEHEFDAVHYIEGINSDNVISKAKIIQEEPKNTDEEEEKDKKDKFTHTFSSTEFDSVIEWSKDLVKKIDNNKNDINFIKWVKDKSPEELFQITFPHFLKSPINQGFEKAISSNLHYLLDLHDPNGKVAQYKIFQDELWKFKDLEVLRIGQYQKIGNLYRARNKLTNKECSVKIIQRNIFTPQQRIQEIDDEIEMVKLLHKNVSKYLLRPYSCEVIETESTKTIIIITEPIQVSLKQLLLQKTIENQTLQPDEAKDVFLGAINGILTLHKLELNLRDLDPKQVFYTDDKRIVLGGYRGFIQRKEIIDPRLLRHYAPSEASTHPKTYDKGRGDSWFLGQLLLTTIGLDIPPDERALGIISEAANDHHMKKAQPELMAIIGRLINREPEKRDYIETVAHNQKSYMSAQGNLFTLKLNPERNEIANFEGLATYHLSTHEPLSAIAAFQECYKLCEDHRYLFPIGFCQLIAKQHKKAKETFSQALSYYKAGYLNVMFWEVLLALVYCDQSLSDKLEDFLKAMDVLQMVSRKVEVLGVQIRPWIVFVIMQYAQFLKESDEVQKALETGLKVKTLANKLYGEKHPLTLKLETLVGKFFLETGHVSKALEHLELPTKILLEQESPNQITLADCLCGLADCYVEKENYGKALNYYGQVFTIYTNMYGEQSPQLIELYCELGNVYGKAKDQANSLSYYAGALDISRKINGDQGIKTNEILMFIARGKLQTKEYPEAIKILKKAEENLTGKKKLLEGLAKRHFDYIVGKVYADMGLLLRKTHEYKRSVEYYNSAVLKLKECGIKDNLLLALTHDSRGVAFKKIHDNFKALEEFELAQSLFKSTKKPDSEERAKTLKHTADTYKILGNDDRALDFFDKAIQTKIKVSGKEFDSLIASCHTKKGQIYMNQSKLDKAKESFNKALVIQKDIRGEQSVKVAHILMNLGKTLGLLGETKKGLELLDETLHLLKKLGRAELKEGLDCLYERGLLFENNGEKKRANEVYKKCLPMAKRLNSDNMKLDSLIAELEGKLDTSYHY